MTVDLWIRSKGQAEWIDSVWKGVWEEGRRAGSEGGAAQRCGPIRVDRRSLPNMCAHLSPLSCRTKLQGPSNGPFPEGSLLGKRCM